MINMLDARITAESYNGAMTQDNLGTARLAARKQGTARVHEAVAASRAAVEERTREKSSAVDAGPQSPARSSPRFEWRDQAARLPDRAAVCRAAAPASARTQFSGIDDGDGLDLDRKIGSSETGNADGRAEYSDGTH